MAIESISITGFKSIASAALALRGLNVVIGPNGAGKSNLIEAFRLIKAVVEGGLGEYVGRSGGAWRMLHHGQEDASRIDIQCRIENNVYRPVLIASSSDTFRFGVETVTTFHADGTTSIPFSSGAGRAESALKAVFIREGGVLGAVVDAVERWSASHFLDTSGSSPAKRMQDIDDNRTLRGDGGNLAAYLFRLSHQYPDDFERIVRSIRRVAPFFGEFRLEPLALNPSKIKLEWRHRKSDTSFDASSLSDGTLRFICLATLLLQPERLMPSLILIDEPELGLHPMALTLLVEMLRSASESSQILAVTQSVTLLDQLTPDEVVVAELHDGASTFRRLEEATLQTWMEEYGLGELWLKNVLGGRPS